MPLGVHPEAVIGDPVLIVTAFVQGLQVTPDGLLEVLSEHIRLYRPNGEPDRWLFPGELDQPLHQNSVGYWWRRTRAAAGQEHRRLHHLRHFYASGLIAAGCDVVTVQRALGHSSATVTLATYAHLWPDANDRTRKAAGDLLSASVSAAADALRTEST
jgi:integrase